MTSVEQWADNFKKDHTWQETIIEILKIYECSPMIDRSHPYGAFSSVLKKCYGVDDEPSWSYELKNSVINEFRISMISRYSTVAAHILVEDSMELPTVARILTKALFSSTKVFYSAKEVSDYCKTCIENNDEETLLYFLAGLTLCADARDRVTLASILSSIAYRLVFNCGKMVKIPKELPKKTETLDAPEDFGVLGKSLFNMS